MADHKLSKQGEPLRFHRIGTKTRRFMDEQMRKHKEGMKKK